MKVFILILTTFHPINAQVLETWDETGKCNPERVQVLESVSGVYGKIGEDFSLKCLVFGVER